MSARYRRYTTRQDAIVRGILLYFFPDDPPPAELSPELRALAGEILAQAVRQARMTSEVSISIISDLISASVSAWTGGVVPLTLTELVVDRLVNWVTSEAVDRFWTVSGNRNRLYGPSWAFIRYNYVTPYKAICSEPETARLMR